MLDVGQKVINFLIIVFCVTVLKSSMVLFSEYGGIIFLQNIYYYLHIKS